MKKRWILLCLAGMLLYTNPVWATPFPDKTNEVIQDEDNYLKSSDRENFEEALKQFPGQYKVVVVESTQPETQSPDEYAQKLYDNYNLSEDTLMVVLDINTEELGVYAGPALQKKGAKPELLHEKIKSYYEPFRNQKEYVKGIELFITELNHELNRQQGGGLTSASSSETAEPEEQPQKSKQSGLAALPWWLYVLGLLFLVLSAALVVGLIRRRSIFAQVDEVEDWKDELVEKINVIEVEKSLRRSTGMTEERFLKLANRKENMLRIRIPDVEMMILEAEEACDRFRFQLALGLMSEARETLASIEQELAELKTDTTKVVTTKQENKLAIPEIGKQFEQVERRLSDLRLEYGLAFHDLKAGLDEVEEMRCQIKDALAAGDDVKAYEMTMNAQKQLASLSESIEQIPPLVVQISKDMHEELKQLEEGITQAIGEGYDLKEHALEGSLLQAKQLLIAARTALEEGSLHAVRTHVKAFEVLLDTTYQSIEETVLAQRQAAAAQATAIPPEDTLEGEEAGCLESEEEADTEAAERDRVVEDRFAVEEQEPARPEAVEPYAEAHKPQEEVHEVERQQPFPAASLSQAEREVLLDAHLPVSSRTAAAELGAEESHEEIRTIEEEEPEYELVIPKEHTQQVEEAEKPEVVFFQTEDEALDELERISSTLVRIRQQIKRSYLPGIPDQLKYMFEEIVQLLAQTQATMEQYRYDLEEVSILLSDANELLVETEKLTERIISACQAAEGAIQYANRYRRQNRQVNDLLSKAEQAFRQLSFQEAYQLAEEARLVIEGEPAETDKRWLLRRKKKG
ncbi:septation ring formation regulator EzrA [Brevibacillus sp. H7]|uniref:septation ring formation regulator EzrA n=1 Tax=Brevibacillus sp. H7 TaxID=3349138 RepID=UPI00380FA80D